GMADWSNTLNSETWSEYRRAAEETAEAQRRLQAEIDRRDRERKQAGEAKAEAGAVQAGPRKYPENPLPPQHLEKPGLESELEPRPRFEAPEYRGSGKLEGRVALITGGDSGIARAVAVLSAREGADVAVAYLNEHADVEETLRDVEKEGRRCILIS